MMTIRSSSCSESLIDPLIVRTPYLHYFGQVNATGQHWRRLVKNIGWAKQTLGGKVVKVINAWAILN